ncbi:HAD family hydrolase [Chloroflexota bacterium]
MTPVNTDKAIIWDMDGVIADTALCHFKAWQEVFQKKGITYPEETFKRYFGQRNVDIIRKIMGKETPEDEISAISTEKEDNFLIKIKEQITPFPGVITLIKSLADSKYKMALASSAPQKNIDLITQTLKIDGCFQAVVSSKDVSQGKPSPQAFLLAASKLGVAPKNCIVFEDAIAGVAAAMSAGMHCIAVTNTNPKGSLAEADLVVDTLEVITVNDLDNLINN